MRFSLASFRSGRNAGPPVCVGVDVDRDMMRLMVVALDSGDPLSVWRVPLPADALGEGKVDVAGAALAKVVLQAGIAGAPASVALGEGEFHVRRMLVRCGNDDEVRFAVGSQMQPGVADGEAARFDFQLLENGVGEEDSVAVLAAAGRAPAVRSRQRLLALGGLRSRLVSVSPVAVTNANLVAGCIADGGGGLWVLVHIGDVSTFCVVVEGADPLSAYPAALGAAQLAQDPDGGLRRLGGEIRRVLGSAGRAGAALGGVSLSGRVGGVVDAVGSLGETLGAEVTVFDPCEALQVEGGGAEFVVAYGLAVQLRERLMSGVARPGAVEKGALTGGPVATLRQRLGRLGGRGA